MVTKILHAVEIALVTITFRITSEALLSHLNLKCYFVGIFVHRKMVLWFLSTKRQILRDSWTFKYTEIKES